MKFLGDIRVLYIKRDSDFVPVGCLTSNDFSEDSEMLLTTIRGAAGWETSIPTKQRYSISFEGFQSLTTTELLSYQYLRGLKRDRSLIEWRISDQANFVDEGFGYISEINEGNAVGEYLSFTGTITGYSQPYEITITGDLFQNGQSMMFQNGEPMIFN